MFPRAPRFDPVRPAAKPDRSGRALMVAALVVVAVFGALLANAFFAPL